MSEQPNSRSNAVAAAPAPGSEALLRDTLKRCSPATVEAALAFRATGDASKVPQVVMGIVERFLDPEMAERLRSGDDSARFMEDLGLDSLTMIEAIMMVEESLNLSIKNEELISLRTVGDLKEFIANKISGHDEGEKARLYKIEEIAALMPQQDPFLFLEEATIREGGASGRYKVSGHEYFLKGHFKDDPVFPASILLEALGQLGVFHCLATASGAESSAEPSIYFTGSDGVRCHRVCRPGDTLELSVELKRRHDPMRVYSGKIVVGGEKAVSAEEISLVFAVEGGLALDGAPASSNGASSSV